RSLEGVPQGEVHGPLCRPGHLVQGHGAGRSSCADIADRSPLVLAEPAPPLLAELVHREEPGLAAAALGAEFGLPGRVGDAQLLGEPLDLLRAAAELPHDRFGYAGDLPAISSPLDRIPERGQLDREAGVARRLVVRSVPLDVAELPGLPAVL